MMMPVQTTESRGSFCEHARLALSEHTMTLPNHPRNLGRPLYKPGTEHGKAFPGLLDHGKTRILRIPARRV